MKATIQYIKEELRGLYPEREIDAFIRLIVEHIFKKDYYKILVESDIKTDHRYDKAIHEITGRLKNYEPVQYILGETVFYDLKIAVNPGVLIPRPETEELVQWIVDSVTISSPAILDIGTGSGCIALSLKRFLRNANVTGLDHSEAAVQTALLNAKNNNLDVSFFCADIKLWDTKDWPKYDIIVSNPPYVLEKEKREMSDNVLKFEPEEALFVTDDKPLEYYCIIARFAQRYCSDAGWVYFEINESFGKELLQLMSDKGFRNVEIKKDINGKDRMLRGQKQTNAII
jgi:release factor glutamine methyltransferase